MSMKPDRIQLPKTAIALVLGLVLISVTMGGAILLSKPFTYRGHTEVNQLLVNPFDHATNDGGFGIVNFLNQTAASFNFTVLNRWEGSIAYNLSFDLQVTYVAIVSISGTLTQYVINPQTGNLADGATFPIAWTIIPDNRAVGLSPMFFAQALANDAGLQAFRADITLTFNLTSQFLDGQYVMVVTCVTP